MLPDFASFMQSGTQNVSDGKKVDLCVLCALSACDGSQMIRLGVVFAKGDFVVLSKIQVFINLGKTNTFQERFFK